MTRLSPQRLGQFVLSAAKGVPVGTLARAYGLTLAEAIYLRRRNRARIQAKAARLGRGDPFAGRRWPPAKLDLLRRLVAAGRPYHEIADIVGRTAAACASMASQRGWRHGVARPVPDGEAAGEREAERLAAIRRRLGERAIGPLEAATAVLGRPVAQADAAALIREANRRLAAHGIFQIAYPGVMPATEGEGP